jgi:hypothetical protein
MIPSLPKKILEASSALFFLVYHVLLSHVC